ncbi:methyltransferase [Corynascus novoguineensis]|uniref:Methyltransferase n=1 Tax=Corynascus novoguineensis TaxID=1126955 RepID=A0AAN7CVD2_9PEZI|nr:methyltransferase [Corynascus novoguineensis]
MSACGHRHEQEVGTSTSSHNHQYFNHIAAEYDERHGKTLDRLIEEIRARLNFIGADWVDDDDDDNDVDDAGAGDKQNDGSPVKTVRLLDYACGTGVVSRVAAYNARAENQGLSPSEMYAYQGNLCAPDDPNPPALASPEFSNFDIAAVGLGFHHFDDPALAARRLAERLKTGGVLLILDFLPHEKPDTSHPAAPTITHHGFTEEHIRSIFEEAGVGKNFALEEVAVVFHVSKEKGAGVKRKIFIARGNKA